MKKIFTLLLSVFILLNGYSQISEGGLPFSFTKNINVSNIDRLNINPLDFNEVDLEDEIREEQGKLPLIGRTIPVIADVVNNGTWTNFKDGSKMWQLKITANGAEGIIVNYSKLKLSYGSSLFLYSSDRSQVIGAFTYKNNRNSFTTQMTKGEEVIIEYYQPPSVYVDPIINIKSIAYIYRDSGYDNTDKDFGGSESCEINVNTSPEGDNAQDQKRGVNRILLTIGASQGWCTGSLINTTDNDCTPYILTADHCGEGASTSNLTAWIFYFNYEATGAANPGSEAGLTGETVTGCSLIANGGSQGTEGSDFYLIETTDPIPDSFNPFWNGWDRSDDGSSTGYGIHHPAGDIKKISHFDSPLISSDYNSSGYTTAHWKVVWASTASGWGVTEGGSSGSPIFNTAGRIIGDLTGGAASCSNQSGPDYYGKIWYSWDQNGMATSSSGNNHIGPYLAPTGTAPMFVDGRNACTTITSDFSANKTLAYKNENIIFTENVTIAASPISTWAWDFGGAAASPATDNTSGPVTVSYNAVGSYTVALDVSDGTLSDDEVKTNYITIVDSLTADINTATWNVSVGASVDFTDASFGGKGTINSWAWTFNSATPATETVQNPTGIVWATAGTYTVQLCVETDSSETDCVTYNIIVSNPTDLQFDFTGTPTTVVAGGTVDFSSTLIANGPITTWAWSFIDADVTTSSAEFPTATWSVVGDYEVSLTASSSDDTQTVTKTAYIHVIDSTSIPLADFGASQTIILPGAIIDYTNLSTNPTVIDSSLWILENADVPNDNIVVMAAGDLASVAYNTTPGYYNATLIIYTALGNDTMFKDDYIYVIDPSDLTPVHANFVATTDRLIQQGWTVEFTDLSTGPVTDWFWEFEGGSPATFSGQFPPAITYNSTDGPFDVKLSVSNSSYADTAYKPEYIIVITEYPWPDPDGFCEEDLANMPKSEARAAYHLISNPGEWGYFPGHNHLKIKYYAEKFTNYTFDKIREVYVAPSRIQNNSQHYNKVKYYVWDVDSVTGMPGNALGYKTTYISDYTQLQYYPVVFDEPIDVFEEFYVGFYLYYPSSSSGEPQDTFATFFSGNRPNGPNTTVCAKSSNNWMTPTQMLGDTLEVSLNIRLKACIIKVDVVDYSDEVKLYPNPTKSKVTIELGDIPVINPDIRVYDITGRRVDAIVTHTYANNYELDLGSQQTGFYFVEFDFIDAKVVKKISLMK